MWVVIEIGCLTTSIGSWCARGMLEMARRDHTNATISPIASTAKVRKKGTISIWTVGSSRRPVKWVPRQRLHSRARESSSI